MKWLIQLVATILGQGILGIVALILMVGFSVAPIAGIVLLTLWLVDAGPWEKQPEYGTREVTGELIRYTNEEFGYRIDYPKNWALVELNPNEMVLGPKDKEYEQIQIGSFSTEPILDLFSESQLAALNEISLQQFFDGLGATNLNIAINERIYEKWDWFMFFTVIYQDTPLTGSYVVKETPSMTYTLLFVQATGADWQEGIDVVASFTLIGD